MSNGTDVQFQNLAAIRAASLAIPGHSLAQDDDESFRCECGYGLGDASGSLSGRFSSHLAEVRSA